MSNIPEFASNSEIWIWNLVSVSSSEKFAKKNYKLEMIKAEKRKK